MRRLALPVAILIALASAAGAAASPVFVLKGHGWGHGVGMSQYGALGRASDGQDYKQILSFYYDGTNVGQTTQSKIRVLLMEGMSSVKLRSSQDFKVGDKTLARFTDWKLVPTSDGKVKVVGKGKFASPATAKPGEGFLQVNGDRYRGDLKIHNRGGSLAVVNVVGLQAYLRSVVPAEMPHDWPSEALKAQALAARSYGVRAARASWFDLYDDTRDQVYYGLDRPGETPAEFTSSTDAVKATAGEVLKYNGDVISAYFSSSNGGRTAASVDTWGGSFDYLVSKSDPFDLNGSNPNRTWTVVLSPSALQNRLGAGRTPADAIVTERKSGRVSIVKLTKPGWARTFTDPTGRGLGPEWFRGALGLRSSRFDLGVLDAVPAKTKAVCGARLRVNVLARETSGVTLQRRRNNASSWTNMSVTKVDGAHFYGIDRPCRGTSYRLHSSAANSGAMAVKVAPKLLFSATQPANNGLKGSVRPLSLAGQTVHVDRKRKDGTWNKNVGTAVVQADGTWHAEFNAVSGTYRARLVPPSSTGLVPGVSPLLNFNCRGCSVSVRPARRTARGLERASATVYSRSALHLSHHRRRDR
jgi:SpoIID/LytB domain protein